MQRYPWLGRPFGQGGYLPGGGYVNEFQAGQVEVDLGSVWRELRERGSQSGHRVQVGFAGQA